MKAREPPGGWLAPAGLSLLLALGQLGTLRVGRMRTPNNGGRTFLRTRSTVPVRRVRTELYTLGTSFELGKQ
jgi:hypothetical protein